MGAEKEEKKRMRGERIESGGVEKTPTRLSLMREGGAHFFSTKKISFNAREWERERGRTEGCSSILFPLEASPYMRAQESEREVDKEIGREISPHYSHTDACLRGERRAKWRRRRWRRRFSSFLPPSPYACTRMCAREEEERGRRGG